MASQWYYEVMEERIGPVSSAKLRGLAQSGAIVMDTPISNSPNGPWIPAQRVQGLIMSPTTSESNSRDPWEDVVEEALNSPPIANTKYQGSRTSKPASESQAHSNRLILEGIQGKTILVEGSSVKILKEGWLLAAKREKAIPIANITSVEVKEPGAFTSGFIQFSIAGGVIRDSSFSFTGGAFDAAGDENSVLFTSDTSYKVALSIKAYIEEFHKATPGVPTSQQLSSADEIRKLKSLLDEGILTAEEFAANLTVS